jgi:hypothetical protein
MLMGGEVIADALVSGILGIDAGDDDGFIAGAGAGAGVGADAGSGVGAAQAQLRMPNSNIRGISISGTMDFIFTSISSLVFNPL